jgi:hypothetical protein
VKGDARGGAVRDRLILDDDPRSHAIVLHGSPQDASVVRMRLESDDASVRPNETGEKDRDQPVMGADIHAQGCRLDKCRKGRTKLGLVWRLGQETSDDRPDYRRPQ